MKIRFQLQSKQLIVDLIDEEIMIMGNRTSNYILEMVCRGIAELTKATSDADIERINYLEAIYKMAKDYNIPVLDVNERLAKAAFK